MPNCSNNPCYLSTLRFSNSLSVKWLWWYWQSISWSWVDIVISCQASENFSKSVNLVKSVDCSELISWKFSNGRTKFFIPTTLFTSDGQGGLTKQDKVLNFFSLDIPSDQFKWSGWMAGCSGWSRWSGRPWRWTVQKFKWQTGLLVWGDYSFNKLFIFLKSRIFVQ